MKDHAIKIYFVLLIHITRSEKIVNFKLFSVAGVYSAMNYEYACCFLHDRLQSVVSINYCTKDKMRTASSLSPDDGGSTHL
jgi:hypothetical protein